MIRLRLASFGTHAGDREIEIVDGELLSSAVKRTFDGTGITENIESIFHVSVNGMEITSDMWNFTKLKKEDHIFVCIKIKTDGAQFAQAVLIIAIAASPLTGVWAAAALIAGSYVISQAFPPPSVNNKENKIEDSQMYSITSQSNATRKFDTAIKVYGRHKVFPVVAASPYIELEADPDTGEQSQYLYAIYDIGLGPVNVEEVKIGNTYITEFNEVEYNLVDPNKPLVNEGTWDDATQREFTIYKGDISADSVGAELNDNQSDGGPLSGYQIIRSAATNTDGLKQEIIVNLVAPSGIYAVSSGGDIVQRNVDFEVYFAPVGTENWQAYNDLAQVDRFRQVGGSTVYNDIKLSAWPAPADPVADTTIWVQSEPEPQTKTPSRIDPQTGLMVDFSSIIYRGLAPGATYIILNSITTTLVVGDWIKQDGKRVAKIASIENYSGAYKKYHFVDALEKGLTIYIYDWGANWPFSMVNEYRLRTWNQNIKNFLYKEVAAVGKYRMSGIKQQAQYAAVRFTPKTAGEYKVRITRSTSTSTADYQVSDAVTVVSLDTRVDSQPINVTKRHTFIEIRIKATGQLNGAIQNLSVIATSVLNVWNGSAFEKQVNSNPAWVYVDLLCGEVSKRPLPTSRLHISSIVEWANYCEEIPSNTGDYTYFAKRFMCCFVLDYAATLQSVIQQVTSSAQASMNIVDGKYGVLLDINRTIPIQVFTPRNSSGFSSSRQYPEKPHGIRVTFIDPTSNWQPSEIVAYDNGYDVTNATEFQDLTAFAATNMEQAWRLGRYFLVQNRLRQETMSKKVDFEHLRCTRGDFVQIVEPAMKVGGTAARVKAVDIPNNLVTIDVDLDIGVGIDYGYQYRSSEGEMFVGLVASFPEVFQFEADGSLPAVGDLIIVGEVDHLVLDCLVKSITPDSDLSATILLIEKAEDLFDYETIELLPGYSPNLSLTVNPDFSPPGEVEDLAVVANTYSILTKGYEYYIDLDWEKPNGVPVGQYEIYVDSGHGMDFYGFTRLSEFRYIVDPDDLGNVHTFKVLAVSVSGKKMTPGEISSVTATPASKSTAPSDVDKFHSDITGEVLQLSWEKIVDLDCSEYFVRYSPSLSANWETSTLLQRVSANTNLVSVQARTGTYTIKATDFNGNESATAKFIYTTIPQLTGLNVIDTITDWPGPLLGSMELTENSYSGELMLQMQTPSDTGDEVYYSEGYYYFTDQLDLGEIYSVRLQAQIEAEGFNSMDLMSNWITLAEVEVMANARSSDWDVELQYRSTETFNSIADWLTLTSIANMAEGLPVNWTEWRKFTIGDATGRIFQFRLKLISKKANITPRVITASIKVDMPDRLESLENQTVGVGGLEISYLSSFGGSFKGPGTTPNVQVTLENASSGDHLSWTYKTLDGFKLVILDGSNNPVVRQVDISIKGYGKKYTSVI